MHTPATQPHPIFRVESTVPSHRNLSQTMRSFVAIAVFGLASAQKGRQVTEPVYTCQNGYTLVGKTCERQTSTPATYFCQQGVLSGDQCLIPAPRDSNCPPGTVPSNGGCTMTDSLPAEKFCPPNTHDIGGECQTYSVTGIVEICQKGVLIGGQCEIAEVVPELEAKACPVGYNEAKGGCWKDAQMDCTPPHTGKRMLQAHSKGVPVPIALGKSHAIPQQQVPAAPRYVPQPSKLAVTNKQCEVKLEAPLHVETSCPPGMDHVNNQCITKRYEPTSIDCSLGEPHLCFPAQTTPANHRCPAGYQKNGDICIRATNVPKNTFCPPGTIEGANGQCMKAIAPIPRCPPGTQLSGELCIGKETMQPTVQVTMTCQGKNCYNH